MTGNTSVVNDAILLVPNDFNKTGSIYYGTPEALTLCSRFTVKFKFKLTDHTPNGPADGFSFFYLNNPPTGLILGGGIGIPPNPNGLLLIFDTHDNNGNNDNPLASLRFYNGVGNYSENNNNGVLTPDVISLNQIIDGNWHSCEIVYNNGDIKIFLDAAQIMNINYNLNMTGNFGFSASTGAQFSNHWLKDVEIKGSVGAYVDLGDDTTVCDNISYALDASDLANDNYLWNTGETTPAINVTAGGTYYVTVTSACGNASDTINIMFNQTLPTPKDLDTILCGNVNGELFRIPVTDTGLTWTKIPDGPSNTTWPLIDPKTPGEYHYYIQKRNGNCPSDTAEVNVSLKLPPNLPMLANQTVCEEEKPLLLSVDTQSLNASLQWNTGDTGCCILVYEPGQYKVIATNYCGSDSADCIINYKICPDFCIWVPNAFTPNRDGKNDYFEAKIYCDLKGYSLMIYNRFGERVYIASKAESKWDGSFKGKPCDVGTYFYYIEASENQTNSEKISMKGDIELIR